MYIFNNNLRTYFLLLPGTTTKTTPDTNVSISTEGL